MTEAPRALDPVGRTRRRLLALTLPLAAVLYVGAEATNPKGTDQIVDTTKVAFKVLPIAEHHTGQLYLSGILSCVALGALAVAFVALATMIRGRGAAVATVAAIVGVIGFFSGALVNVLVGFNLAAVAAAHLSRDAGAAFLVTTFKSGVASVLLDLYAFAEIYFAPTLMAIALWRSRCVPRWLVALFFIGLEIAEQVPSAGPARVLLEMAPFFVAMMLLALRMWGVSFWSSRSGTP
jgi:hypothetical protein